MDWNPFSMSSPLNPVADLKSGGEAIYHGVGNAVSTPQQPGVGGPLQLQSGNSPTNPLGFYAAKPGAKSDDPDYWQWHPPLKQDPITGKYYDGTTGQTFNDPQGQSVVLNPNVAQQVASNIQQADSLRAAALGDKAKTDSVFNAQTGLATSLNNTINNPNAPSVAREQLGEGLDAAARQQLSQSAGQTGQNAFLASRNAMNNIAELGAKTNQSTGLARAQEVAAAQGRLGDVLNAQGTGARALYNTDTGAGIDYSKTAMQGQEDIQGLNATTNKENKDRGLKVFGAGAKAVGDIFSPGG